MSTQSATSDLGSHSANIAAAQSGAPAPTSPAVSVLDLVPVRSGQTSAEAVRASLDLVRLADALGFRRYWFAEHHNMPAVAASTPPVMISAAATITDRIRVGSGGVMLPNHAPLVVAEQFAALEAIAPGRIDLGIGRAPGSDPVITALLRATGPTADVDRFPQHVRDILALVDRDGAALELRNDQTYEVRATPAAATVPELWLLGSSDYSARLAAQLGLPYVFANHFAGAGLEQAMAIYRGEFQPGVIDSPHTFVTTNVVVADTVEEAQARALPQLRQMARIRTGLPLTPIETVEQAQNTPMPSRAEALIDAMRGAWIIDAPAGAAERIRELAHTAEVDEVMVVPVAGSRVGEPVTETPGRVRTLELLHQALSTAATPAAV